MEKKLNVAIIGQGRSGKDIHGAYLRSENNIHFNVKYAVDKDEHRRRVAEQIFPGCKTFADYKELFAIDDIDLVINASYSEMHYPISLDLVNHGFNVLVEKPIGANSYECGNLIKAAKEAGVVLAAFQNTQTAPFYVHARKLVSDGVLGDVKQVSIRYNGFARRWDWQTMQKKLAGSAYNTGPHPIAMGLGFLDFDENARVIFSKLDTALTSGDAEDFVKLIITAPGKPIVDIEISAIDAFCDYTIKIQGSRGTLKSKVDKYRLKYIVPGENPERPVIEESLSDENGNPIYCSEKLITHDEEGEYEGTAFDVGSHAIYEGVYGAITEGKPLAVPIEHAAATVSVIEAAHAQNPLPVKF